MSKLSKKVVIINDIKSDSIEQAIFILRTPKKEYENYRVGGGIAGEAENIINSFVRASAPSDSRFRIGKMRDKTNAGKRRILYLLMWVSAICGLILLSKVGYAVVDAVIAMHNGVIC